MFIFDEPPDDDGGGGGDSELCAMLTSRINDGEGEWGI